MPQNLATNYNTPPRHHQHMFETSHRAVSSLTQTVRTQLHNHRAAGRTDDEYLTVFIETFVAQARQQPGPGILIHTAIGLYNLAIATDEIVRLNEVLAMHESLLELITDTPQPPASSQTDTNP
jgi:hypothetical protein